MGGFLDRETSPDYQRKCQILALGLGLENYLPFLNAYFEEIRDIFRKYAPMMLGESGRRAVAEDAEWQEDVHTGANLIDHGLSQIHLHTDSESMLPALITCCNPAGSQRQWRGGGIRTGRGWNNSALRSSRCVNTQRKSVTRGFASHPLLQNQKGNSLFASAFLTKNAAKQALGRCALFGWSFFVSHGSSSRCKSHSSRGNQTLYSLPLHNRK